MGGTKQKKYQKGAATAFISRNKALKKLQLNLPNFRVLCIFKGIYPVEPLHHKKVNKGSSEVKTYYNLKDIQFLAHDNLIARFREKKHYIRRLKKAIAKGNKDNEDVIRDNKPVFNLTTVIRERYPSFIDALRDLDDCLNLCFVFSNFPSSKLAHKKMIQLCWQRTVEFQNYIIATKALRKVFVSIKGIYHQADIKGETITWVTGHKRGFEHPKDVDFKVMKTFAEYYSVLLGHINIKLFSEAGYVYPPQLAEEPKKSSVMYLEGDKVTECLASLALPIKKTGGSVDDEDMEDEDLEVDEMNAISADDPDMIEKSKIEAQSIKKLQNLFKGMKFFLNREVPLQELALVIRCCSGEVSWDNIVATGSTYQESDQSITHHIVDRPSVPNQKITRTYVQPQWVFDCINARAILPAKDYFPGVAPPPHLSPFVEDRDGDYVPDDKVKFLKKSLGEKVDEEEEEEDKDSSSDEDDQENEGSEEEDEEEEDDEDESEEVSEPSSKKRKRGEEVSEPSSKKRKRGEEDEEETSSKAKTANMAVTEGTVKKVDKQRVLQTEAIEERKLGEMMIPKKHRRLYNKIMFSRKKTSQETRKLQEKKEKITLEKKKQKKLKKKDK